MIHFSRLHPDIMSSNVADIWLVGMILGLLLVVWLDKFEQVYLVISVVTTIVCIRYVKWKDKEHSQLCHINRRMDLM